jgi:N-acetylneuraminic acid mutarotase
MTWTGTSVLMFGGMIPAIPNLLTTNDLWSYDPGLNSWTQLIAANTPGSPPTQWAASLVATPSGVILFGGYDPAGNGQSALWSYDPVTNQWTRVLPEGDPGSPSARYSQSMVWDGNEVILWGGEGSHGVINDLWWYDPPTGTWTLKIANGDPSSPPARGNQAMAWDGTNAVLFGGDTFGPSFNDLWCYDPSTNSWTQKIAQGAVGSPASLAVPSMVWDGSRVVLFGGVFNGSGAFNTDLWGYDPATNAWTVDIAAGAASSPEGGTSLGFVFDGERAILFDNYTNTTSNGIYWYQPATPAGGPTITSVLPALAVSGSGGVAVTISGTHFIATPSVTVGGRSAANVTLLSSTTLTCTLPDEPVGREDVVVTNPDGENAILTGGFQRTLTSPTTTQLVFVTGPTTTWVGAPIRPVVQVALEDASGNVVPDSRAITVSLVNPRGATLGGTITVNAVNGLASFPDLTVNAASTGYALAAAVTGLPQATSGSFQVVVSPGAQLAFVVQPSSVKAQTNMSPAVQVAVQDNAGNTLTSVNVPITVALASSPSGGVLSGTTTVNAVNGVATFSDLQVSVAGSGYTLSASAYSVAGPTSQAFTVTP